MILLGFFIWCGGCEFVVLVDMGVYGYMGGMEWCCFLCDCGVELVLVELLLFLGLIE